jgi:hypothetical protein
MLTLHETRNEWIKNVFILQSILSFSLNHLIKSFKNFSRCNVNHYTLEKYSNQIFHSGTNTATMVARMKFTCSRIFGQWVIQGTCYWLKKIHFLSLPCGKQKKYNFIHCRICYQFLNSWLQLDWSQSRKKGTGGRGCSSVVELLPTCALKKIKEKYRIYHMNLLDYLQ